MKRLGSTIQKIGHNLVRRAGFQLVDANWVLRSQDVLKFIESLESNNNKRLCIFDIGAYRGNWSVDLSRYYPNADFILFEPSNLNKEYLGALCKSRGWTFIPVALGKSKGKRKFYSKGLTSDSFYREHGKEYKDRDIVEVETARLDDLVEEFNLRVPDLIKIDCQGAELDVLYGARKTLNCTRALVVELQVIETNEGAATFSRVLEFLIELGFFPFAVYEVHNRNGILNQIDLIFFRDLSDYKNRLNLYQTYRKL